MWYSLAGVLTQLGESSFWLGEAGWTLAGVKVSAVVFRVEICHELVPEDIF